MMDAAHSVLSIPLSHREPTTLSFQVNRGEIYNGQYPHLQVHTQNKLLCKDCTLIKIVTSVFQKHVV